VKATYDAKTNTLSIILKADARVAESDEDKPSVILDYDEDGNLVSLEILDASLRVTDTPQDDSTAPLVHAEFRGQDMGSHATQYRVAETYPVKGVS
jgi:uncharacterized protein YuzE